MPLLNFLNSSSIGLSSEDKEYVPPPCSNYNPEWWYESIDGVNESREQRFARHHRARTICKTCPIKTQCLEQGIKGGEWGVWGGELLYGRTDKGPVGPVRRCRNCGTELLPNQRSVCSRVCAARVAGANQNRGPRIDVNKVRDMHEAGKTVHEIAEYMGVAPSSLSRAARRVGDKALSSKLRWRENDKAV